MILHICGRDEWPPATEDLLAGSSVSTEYRPASLATEGFVHCSDFGTAHLPANRIFAGRTDLVLLVIDTARLDVPVRWEPAAESDDPAAMPWFPHVYGPIPERAVIAVHAFPPDAKGAFTLPTALADNRP
ncbi:DUF952 domain-containing protein [Actinocrispum wychmicini]|uniref:Uncharacterized protein (DUF952 family) n=1 Tax=Actinocrispum wychmicini TaxID=1213861 RepID=A0A4R2K411_9PSEU|nr:DUF952 domain-containing protein [Actinocrispum wychmicini]TCO64546.1 uncharacterized protein (DUF952 family) [Actinocrispum wychmicini]